MFAAIDSALTRLYPSHRWNERRDPSGAGSSIDSVATCLSDRLAERLSALCVYLPGSALEYCSYVYVLCTGRSPALVELREGLCRSPDDGLWPGRGALEPDPSGWQELYLRVALSGLAPFAAVQQVAMRGRDTGRAAPVRGNHALRSFRPPAAAPLSQAGSGPGPSSVSSTWTAGTSPNRRPDLTRGTTASDTVGCPASSTTSFTRSRPTMSPAR